MQQPKLQKPEAVIAAPQITIARIPVASMPSKQSVQSDIYINDPVSRARLGVQAAREEARNILKMDDELEKFPLIQRKIAEQKEAHFE